MDLQGDWMAKKKMGEWADHEGAFDDEFFKDFKTTDSGFKFKIVQQGEGEKAQPFQKVFVHYSGYLLNGKKFDSSYDKGEPFGFRMSKGKVIPGWETVVAGMNPGMKVIVQIPPQYAYGDKGVGNGLIPPNSPLVFYMELRRLGSIKGDKPRLGGIMADTSDAD
jgi:FKBP-type peptidyl-prolyl cis-trans isomerase